MQAAHTHTSKAKQAEREGRDRERGRERAQKSMALAEWADKVGRPAICDDDDAIWRPPNVVTDSTLAGPHSLPLPLPALPVRLASCLPQRRRIWRLAYPLFMAEQVFPWENALA